MQLVQSGIIDLSQLSVRTVSPMHITGVVGVAILVEACWFRAGTPAAVGP